MTPAPDGGTTLVETKFFHPSPRADLVRRTRLDTLLDDRTSRLTLVSAPAGFGKTTLLVQWLAAPTGAPRPRVAWVSLDEADRNATTFWTYVLTALDRTAPGTGASALELLGAGRPTDAALAAAVNELSVLPDDVLLVLDDYHLAESPEVQQGVAFLVDHLPPQVHLVISTRADPGLPLARLRARGELTEVRAADLRFTDPETSRFLGGATGRELAAEDVAALGARTEGWVASLQLAALTLRGRDDASAFIAGFAGTDRFVVDYLVEEVLDREPAEVREFLLATAVLDRLCGPLCDAVTGTNGGDRTLATLERRNLFLVPLDDQRQWYRYHHLFADVLRAHLHGTRPEAAAGLHRRAGDWFAGAGHPEEAVRHALAAGDTDRAADLAEESLPRLRRERREAVMRRWAHELPEEVVRDRPVLAVGLVGGLMASNDVAGVRDRLADIDALLAGPRERLVVLDRAELARLPAAVQNFRAALALVDGDLEAAVAHADRALELAVPDDHLARGGSAGLGGLASWATGDVLGAHRSYGTCVAALTRAGHVADVLGCSLTLADLELALGRLGDAQRTLEHALALADRHGPGRPHAMRGTADMLVALSRVAWHRNDLTAATEYLRTAEELGEGAGLPQHPYRWRVALARLRAADGDLGTALELLDEAERVHVGDFSPPVHPVHATRARVLAASGDVDGALDWARRHGIGVADDLHHLHEYEHVTLARVLLTEGSPRARTDACGLLDRLVGAAAAGARQGSVLEIEVLRAVAHQGAGDDDTARLALEHAVELAEPDGWVRVFVDAGPGLTPSLRDLAGRHPARAFLHLLAAGRAHAAGSSPRTPAPPAAEALVDPLSERELDVLRFLATDLDGPAIARELVVSLNTVRTHTRHIYTKLDVTNRRAAVTRAHRLGLLRQR